MLHTKNTVFYATLVAVGFFASSCSKKDEALETDYTNKKATADRLISDVTTGMGQMKTEHAALAAQLDSVAKTPNADTAKINEFRAHEAKHEDASAAVMTAVDSVKMYMNVSPDKADQYKYADERLGVNTDDLQGKWKAYQDAHNVLKTEVMAWADATSAVKAEIKADDSKKEAVQAKKKAASDAVQSAPAKDDGKMHTPAVQSTGGEARRPAKH